MFRKRYSVSATPRNERKEQQAMMKRKSPDITELTNYVNLERLTFLVDGVFAITMTLLVLELRPPEAGIDHLAQGLLAMLPRLYIYFIAFYSIANHWVVHQRMFRHITGGDTTMLWLTVLGLLFITLIPASTAIVGRFPAEKLAAACFSANSFLQAMTSWLFWAYVEKHQKQFASATDPRMLMITSQVWLIITAGWLISILLGFVNVYFAYASWILWPNLVAVWGNHKRRILLKS
ncbi:MAG TPA: TMEM175 family protein [Anaerolineales bacterium]|nr:TMEM175 family protein [Anaerolineales bacterium]